MCFTIFAKILWSTRATCVGGIEFPDPTLRPKEGHPYMPMLTSADISASDYRKAHPYVGDIMKS
jgi:hypothetical protein